MKGIENLLAEVVAAQVNIQKKISEITSNRLKEQQQQLGDLFVEASKDLVLAIDINSRQGWCMTGQMVPVEYMNLAFTPSSTSERDRMFDEYFAEEFLEYELDEILEHCHENWNEVLSQSVDQIKIGKYHSIIPTLIIYLEYCVSSLLDSTEINSRLMRDFNRSLDDIARNKSVYELKTIDKARISVLYALSDVYYISNDFNNKRLPDLNRHWILHGRDNPQLWSMRDVKKLISVLSCLTFILSKA
ncbi:hypothetical protein [Terribacillus saccharophilus]|uniref:hypothetical protein n=1 Tax=Terribacillus saccharophilus TaxID=361277 RepID=UPI000BA64AB8|nr:hypothetical protein [Terribacillus saccharophilus]PAF15890.1 hypothetical protein CHH51_18235 [Terribacillus saccharophilus]